MKITDMQIQKHNKARANLYLDGEFAFALEMLTVMKLGLKIGQEVSEEKLQEAVFDSERSVAFEKAMDYLARGRKTEKQMRDYLNKKLYAPRVVQYVVEKLKDYRYLNDEDFARAYVEQNQKSKGSRRLQQELLQKGVKYHLAEEASQQSTELSHQNAEALAQKYMKNKTRDVKDLQRLQRYLLSRGYDFDTVNSIVRKFRSVDSNTDILED